MPKLEGPSDMYILGKIIKTYKKLKARCRYNDIFYEILNNLERNKSIRNILLPLIYIHNPGFSEKSNNFLKYTHQHPTTSFGYDHI